MNLKEIVATMTAAGFNDADICRATGLTRSGLAIIRS